MLQLQQHAAELQALEVDVAVVTFERLSIAQAYRREMTCSWPILIDESRELYRAYGMDRGSARAIFGPASWGEYLKYLLRGRKLRLPTGDVHQLGGNVLIDPEGIVRLHYVSRTPIDRPEIGSMLEIVRRRFGRGAPSRAE